MADDPSDGIQRQARGRRPISAMPDFRRFEKLGDAAHTQAILSALDARPDGGSDLVRANLLRRMGDLAGASAAFATLGGARDAQDGQAGQEWTVVPAGFAFAGMAIAPLICIDGLLPNQRMEALYRKACDLQPAFTPRQSRAASQGGGKTGQMLLLSDFGEERAFFSQFVDANLPAFRECLGMPGFEVAEVEIKLLNNLHGGYLTIHSDHGRESDSEGRAITCLYYFGERECARSGGDLYVLDSLPAEARFSGTWFTRVEPRRNRFIAFPSWFFHAVSPVVAASVDFAEGRMAVSCQVRKRAGRFDAWWNDIGEPAGNG